MKNYTDLQHKKVLVLGLAKVVWLPLKFYMSLVHL